MRNPFRNWKIGFGGIGRRPSSDAADAPLRAELFSGEQLQRHAVALAGQHELDPERGPNRLLTRLAENERVLAQTYDLVTVGETEGRRVTSASEWLLDNFFLVEQQICVTQSQLPRTYSAELPRLLIGPAAGFPRVYDIALELIAHVDARVDSEHVSEFVTAYQTVTPLTLGELWAVPIMLRLGLIENLRRVAVRIAAGWTDRNLADTWTDRLVAAAEKDPASVLRVLAELAQSKPSFSSAFVDEFCRQLEGQGPALATVESWVQHHLADQGQSREQMRRADSQDQATDQVSIANSIGSLRFLSVMNWPDFVESMSVVEQTLRTDPSAAYPAMDFATRDHYRHSVELLSRRAGITENEVALAAIKLAKDASVRDGTTTRTAHVGFYLIDKGRHELDQAVGVRRSFRSTLVDTIRRHPLFYYLGVMLMISAGTVGLAACTVLPSGRHGWYVWLMLLLGFTGASQMAMTLVNLLVNLLAGPRLLPRLDFSEGIPEAHRTMVVIPTLLTSVRAVTDLVEKLEVRYLGNRDPNLFFALLTDFSDANEATQPEDAELLRLVREGIASLNAHYSDRGVTPFHLFHRERLWNPHEGVWMGYERKRGKLEQFNALLRGGPSEVFADIISELSILHTIQFVITLDTDTGLPHAAAHKLIGALAHPLNRPQFDAATGRVIEGYAILQPRTPISLLSANLSRFARLSAGEAGIDPYTREVSDVYQDLFAEGSYVGKGIYDVDAFRQATANRFPENLILSHDLLESGFARSALVSDVVLHEDHPASLAVEMSRCHRWIRGDWQIAGWLFPHGLDSASKRIPNKLSALGWWKIFDSLRRSLVPPALLLLLLSGWLMSNLPTGFWTLFVLVLLLLPMTVASLVELVRKPRERTLRIHLRTVIRTSARRLAEAGLAIAALPYRAVINLDAIVDSGVRMLFTRRGLLLWHTPRYAKRNQCVTPGEFLREMWVAPFFAIVGLTWLTLTHRDELFISGPVLLLWLVSPIVGWWISLPLVADKPGLSGVQQMFLHGMARRTWHFFDAFVNAEEHWLPPDNFQEVPHPVVATRTSPTNIGMALLANLAASDFGYITIAELLDRTENTLATMERLERFRGHFYNWYDTRTLKPLSPLYISSVDSGNLAGALVTLRAGLEELKNQPIVSPRVLDGLHDTLAMMSPSGTNGPLRDKLQAPAPDNPADTMVLLHELSTDIADLSSADDASPEQWVQALARQCRAATDDLRFLVKDPEQFDHMPTLLDVAGAAVGGQDAVARISRIEQLAQRCDELAEMDFTFLYDSACDLLAVGYDVTDRRRDKSYYDLLASEARVASFILVARDQLPQEHWFALGRQLTTHEGSMALLSWSGSMFEYLMPLLIMPTFEHTLLDQTYRAVVGRQIEYGRQRGVPWGISESCYSVVDAQGTYQYRAFGVPGLGFKRGLADDLVVAPYASALALMVAPREACQNLERLAAEGFQGDYGLYEAIDFTPARLPRGKRSVPLHSYMSHHQGMSFLALTYLLLDQPMQRRFISDPWFKASELLLCERIPKVAMALQPHAAEVSAARQPLKPPTSTMRVFASPHTPIPEAHLLSNGRYHVMATNAGGGYSRWKNLAITRWREDATCDDQGTFCYLRDTATLTVWSSAYQPTRRPAKAYEAIFVQGRAEYRCRAENLDAHTEIAVSPEDDVEVRRVTLTNRASHARTIELTSYAEVLIAPLNSDLAHPAFSNLFVQTEILQDAQAILCSRRPRAPGEKPAWMFHLMTAQGTPFGDTSYETDRAKFIGRSRSAADPATFDQIGPLSNTQGSVLDPIVAIRRALVIDVDSSANWHIITGMAETREAALMLVEKYRDANVAARAFDMAWSHSQVMLRQWQTTEVEAQVFAQLASSVIYANPLHRAGTGVLARNRLGQSGLWAFGVSGDLPILLMRISDIHRIDLVKQVVHAHGYWHEKGLEADLVILNEDYSGYRQELHDLILGLITTGAEAHRVDKPGGIFLRRSEQLSDDERVLLQTVARVIVTDSAETLPEQTERQASVERRVPLLVPTRSALPTKISTPPARERIFFNGLGGFTTDGREYVITLDPGRSTPAPWSNVLANSRIGAVISESGGAYTWVDNANEFRITPWHNDPVCDRSGEAFYIRDDETGEFWSPTPLPARGTGTYVCRHGFGYSAFEYTQSEISSELWMYVAPDAPVKLMVLKIRNQSGRTRSLSSTGCWELVLGRWRNENLMHVVTETDPNTGALFAHNVYNREFAEKIVFVNVNDPTRTVTGSRTEFLGRNGSPADPAAMHHTHLSGRTGAGLDPCAGLQVQCELADGEEREWVFVMGAGDSIEEAHQLVRQFSGSASARLALENVWEFWKRTLGVVHVQTPDPALNLLVNGWLEYQTLACRYWGRSGYYQSGGAYGFRDQLQDTAALLHAAPWTAREHLLRCAGRQFREGDVQHWWHPPAGRGVRTHFSDDYLWLPYATIRYVTVTGDTGVLDERAPFLVGRPVTADEESYYYLPQLSGEDGTLYEHCVRAIKHGLRFGEHGLPLMGCGDWNDGMNLVGAKGKGESVWLAFFMSHVLKHFAELAKRHGDTDFAEHCAVEAAHLRQNIERHGWDGQWYRRAYFDDGTPLGSATNDECQIDSIAQSWAVLSGAAEPPRALLAMESVDQRLVRRDAQMIQLFDPPFDSSTLEPGYIKGYVPGVRENGGQYTHAAIWTVMAFAELGDTERAWELFSMINPINHATDLGQANRYHVEPYVAVADIYSVAPHTGRGGWSWYTGSAGWMYRLIVESLLGLSVEADQLRLTPRMPRDWDSFNLHYRYRETFYHISVKRAAPGAANALSMTVDGKTRSTPTLQLIDDQREHDVELLVPDA